MYLKHLTGILVVSLLLASVAPAFADYQKWGIVWNTSHPQRPNDYDAGGNGGVAILLSDDGHSRAIA